MRTSRIPDAPSDARSRSIRQRPLAWSALALVVLAGSGVVITVLDRVADAETRSSFRWATHTLEVEDQLHRWLAALAEAESAQRGYVVSGDAIYLAPQAEAAATARQLQGSLRSLTADNVAQQRRLDTLDRLVDARLALLRSGVALVQAGRRESAESLIRTGRGRLMMDSIRATVRHAVDNEEVLLNQRQQAVEGALAKRRIAEELIVGLAVLALILAATIWLRLRRAERLVIMCAWSKAIQLDGEWMSIEAYMARRFGLSITHGISPAEIRRLEAEMDAGPAIATVTAGIAKR